MRKAIWVVLSLVLVGASVTGYFWWSKGVPPQAQLDPRQLELRDWMSQVIQEDPRNKGVEVSVYFGGLSSKVLVFELQNVGGENSPTDVFRVFLQFADKAKKESYQEVHLFFRGKHRFTLKGSDFQEIGKEHGIQNPIYVVRTFPEKLTRPDGTSAFSSWEGGLLGVSTKQLEDFNEFHKQWYLTDLLSQSK